MNDRTDTAPARHRPLRRLLGGLLTLAVLALAATTLLPTALGYGRYVLVSGSMTGTYDTGSVVYTKDRPVSSLRVGQVITYAPPAGASPQRLVTHRIVDRRIQDGRLVLRTKGDANQSADPWTFTLRDRQQAVVSFGVPYVGYVISAFADRRVRMVVVGVPAALIALLAVVGLVREAAREAREEREDDAPDAGEPDPEVPSGDAGDAVAAGPWTVSRGPAAGETATDAPLQAHTVFPAHRRARWAAPRALSAAGRSHRS
jgi:signal peptidase